MTRPVAVRIGIGLLVLAPILRATALLVSILHPPRAEGATTSAAGEAASLLFYSAFLYAISQRRNWARLVLALLYVSGIVFFTLIGGGFAGLQLAVLVLVGGGLVCLFVPSAAAWYRSPTAAA